MYKKFSIFALTTFAASGLALIAATPQDAPPQNGGGETGHRHAPDPDRQVRMLSKRLNLTDDQKAKIKPVLEERTQQMQSIRSDSSLSPEDRRGKMKSLMQDSDSKLKAVLNDDQKQKYDTMQQQQRERMHDRRQGGAPNGSDNQ